MEEIVSTRGGKVRGVGTGTELRRSDLEALAETHVVFNSLVQRVSFEIISHIKGNGSPELSAEENALLRSYLRVVFKTGAAEGNHLLTRLLQSHGKDGSDRNVILGFEQETGEVKGGVRGAAQTRLKELPIEVRRDFLRALKKQLSREESGLLKDPLKTALDDPSSRNLRALSVAAKELNSWKSLRGKALTVLTLILQTYAEEKSEAAELVKDCAQARALLDRRAEKKFAPWGDLACHVEIGGKTGMVKLSELSESWQRQICQAAIEALKSHVNLKDFVASENKEWALSLHRLEALPDVEAYRVIRPKIVKVLGENPALNRMSPPRLFQVLELLGETLHAWRTPTGKQFVLNAALKGQANAWGRMTPEEQKRTARSFRRDVAALYPEVWAALDLHQNYERLTGRRPQQPTLTVPDPYVNPKHVMWSQQQWQKIELRGESPLTAQGDAIRVRLPLLAISGSPSEGRVVEEARWFRVTGDPRLTSLRRRNSASIAADERREAEEIQRARERGERYTKRTVCQFEALDPARNVWTGVNIGAIRLVPSHTRRRRLDKDTLHELDFNVKVTLKQPTAKTPQWVGGYLRGKEIDPNTNEPRLPEKLVIASFVPDLLGRPVIRAARLLPASHGQRRLEWLPEVTLQSLAGQKIPTAQDVAKARAGAERLTERRLRIQALIGSIGRNESSVSISMRQFKTDYQRRWQAAVRIGTYTGKEKDSDPVVISREQLVSELKHNRRLERENWRHITALGEDRANRFAGAAARCVAMLREKYPGHEVAFVLEHRQERSPSKAVWSKNFNKMVMSVAGAAVLKKVKDTLSRLDPPVAVIERPVNGLTACNLFHDATVNTFQVSLSGSEVELQKSGPVSITVRQLGDGKIKVHARDTGEVVAEGLVRALVRPSLTGNMLPRAEQLATQQALFRTVPLDGIKRILLSRPNA